MLGRLTYSSVVGVNLSFFKNINLEFWFLVFIFVGRKIVFWFIESLNLLSRFLSPPGEIVHMVYFLETYPWIQIKEKVPRELFLF